MSEADVAMMTLGLFSIMVILFIAILLIIFSKRRTKVYREELSDLYIASKIREIANNEDIDLNAEKNQFTEWSKKKRLIERDLGYDSIVEEELKEKVATGLNKEKPKKK